MTDDNTRRKRLKIRCWRRGMREMDLILGPFADEKLVEMAGAELDRFEQLLQTDDQSLYAMFCGKSDIPPEAAEFMQRLHDFHKSR